MFSCSVILKVLTVVNISPTLKILCNIDNIWILYPNILQQADKFQSNAIEVINVRYVIDFNIFDYFN